MSDLEATLAIRVNRSELDAAIGSIRRDIEQGVQATFARAAAAFGGALGGMGFGGGGGTASTGAPGHSGSGVGSGVGSTGASSGGGFGGGRSSGPGAPPASTGAPAGSRPPRGGRDLTGGDGGPIGRAAAAVPGLAGRGSFGAGLSAGASFAGDIMKEAAQRRAEGIQDGSVPGGAAAMGLLRYANPAAVVATAIAAGVTATVRNSQEANDQFAGMSRDLARGTMAGAFANFSTDIDPRTGQVRQTNRLNTRHLFAHGALAENGAMTPQEVTAYGRAYESGVGYSRPISTERSLWALRKSGASDSSIFGLMSSARLGNVDNADPTRFIGLAQSQGLAGSGIDRYLQVIAQMTTRLASQGIKIDQRDQAAMLTAMRLTPGMENVGERGAAAMDALGGMAGDVLNQFLDPQKQYAKALMIQEVLKGGGSYEDVVRRSERFAGSATEQFATVQKGGKLAMRGAMPSLTMGEIDAGVGIDSATMRRARDTKYDVRTADKVEDEDGNSLFKWPSVKAILEAERVNNRGSLGAYEDMSTDAAGWKSLSQDIGNLTSSVNSWAGDLSSKFTIENMQRWMEPVVRAVNELKAER